MKAKSFKQLIVWQKSVLLAKVVYKTTALLPQNEQYGLMSQIRRCAVGIPSNIAEGSRRKTRQDYLQFLHIASGSAAELETQCLIAKEVYPQIDFSEVDQLLLEVQKMLSRLILKLS